MAGNALAASECAGLPHASPHPRNALGDFFVGAGAAINPEIYEQQRRGIAARATYEALLAAGAPETLACAAALNPQVFQTVGPMYLRPSR
jgi:hypothetical protein